MAKALIVCSHCKKEVLKESGEITRAKKGGHPLYCNRTCAGLGRRKHLTKEFLVERKRLYDIEYRKVDVEAKQTKRAAYHKRTYNPVKAAIERQKTMARHIAYCQRPEYITWKREYDKKYRAKKNYGEFWESFLLVQDIETEVLSRTTRYDIMLANGTIAKNQKRKRAYAKTTTSRFDSGEPEGRTLGDLARHSGRDHGWWSG